MSETDGHATENNGCNGIGERLKALRGNTSQGEYAKLLGVTTNTIGRYERGERTPDVDFLSAACRATGANPRWLILGEGPMYDVEASQERPHLTGKDLRKFERVEDIPHKGLRTAARKTMKGAQEWWQRWSELPDWAKDYIEELEEELEEAKKEMGETKAELLKAKDDAIQALKSKDSMPDLTPASVLLLAKALKAAGALESPEKFPEVNIEGLRRYLDEQQSKK